MKVNELIEQLQGMDPEAEVILQKDAEGNGYAPLRGADPEAVYVPENSWSGEVYDTNLDADDHCLEEEEWQELLKKPRCVVLYPV
jgi:hypothetical protein